MREPLEFFIHCVPFKATHHAKRIVRIGKFSRLADKAELRIARETYESLLVPFQIREPYQGPIALGLFFYFPYPKSMSEKQKRQGAAKITKPDCSNLAKTFEDCLVRMGFLEGDQQVVKLITSKAYSEGPGIRVIIEPCPVIPSLHL